MINSNISQHFRSDERDFISQILDMIGTAAQQYRPVLSDFLNPRQVFIANTLVNREDGLCCQTWGGYPNAEMQKMLIYPDYYEPTKADYNISVLALRYPVKFAELHHRQILGTLMGSGLKRSSFGDIINHEMEWQVIANTEVKNFIQQEIDRIGKVKVQMELVDDADVLHPDMDGEYEHVTVPSMRLDAVIANIFHFSRNRAKESIEHGLVRVNWEEIDRPDYRLAAKDLISVRHGGRIKIVEIAGRNRKNNIRLGIQLVKA